MEQRKKETVLTLSAKKKAGMPITMVTAYDYTQARLVEAGQIDTILVGDSLGNVMLGYDTTIPVTLDDMVHHAKAVRRGAQNTMMIVDMPFITYHQTPADTVRNAGRLMQEAFADAVKLEGGHAIATSRSRYHKSARRTASAVRKGQSCMTAACSSEKVRPTESIKPSPLRENHVLPRRPRPCC